MPPRYAYWTIIIDGAPTAFRAGEQADLLPTLGQLRRKHPDAVMKWFARGRLWDSPEQAKEALEHARARPRPPAGERRGPGWRPGGAHVDPRAKFDQMKKDRNRRMREARFRGDRPGADDKRGGFKDRFARDQRGPGDRDQRGPGDRDQRGPGDRGDRPAPKGPPRFGDKRGGFKDRFARDQRGPGDRGDRPAPKGPPRFGDKRGGFKDRFARDQRGPTNRDQRGPADRNQRGPGDRGDRPAPKGPPRFGDKRGTFKDRGPKAQGGFSDKRGGFGDRRGPKPQGGPPRSGGKPDKGSPPEKPPKKPDTP